MPEILGASLRQTGIGNNSIPWLHDARRAAHGHVTGDARRVSACGARIGTCVRRARDV